MCCLLFVIVPKIHPLRTSALPLLYIHKICSCFFILKYSRLGNFHIAFFLLRKKCLHVKIFTMWPSGLITKLKLKPPPRHAHINLAHQYSWSLDLNLLYLPSLLYTLGSSVVLVQYFAFLVQFSSLKLAIEFQFSNSMWKDTEINFI